MRSCPAALGLCDPTGLGRPMVYRGKRLNERNDTVEGLGFERAESQAIDKLRTPDRFGVCFLEFDSNVSQPPGSLARNSVG